MTDQIHNPDRGIYVNTFVRVLGRHGFVRPQEYRETLAERGADTSVVVAKGCLSPHLACYATTDQSEIEEQVTLPIDKGGRVKLP